MASLSVLRRSAAELLALALTELFPGILIAKCGTTELGFFCDVIATQPIDDNALPLLEEKMRGVAKQDLEVRSLDMMREVAANYLKHKGQLLRSSEVLSARENIVSLIQIGDFCDYCPLPYIATTREAEFIKLLKVEPLSSLIPERGVTIVKRIHGIAAQDKQGLKNLVKALNAGHKSNHTKLQGAKDVFSLHEEICSLGCIWDSKGTEIKRVLTDWWENEHKSQNFGVVSTPIAIKKSLMDKAGVFDDVPESQPVFEIDGEIYCIPPSKSPSHMALFQEKSRLSQELPVRIAECAPVLSQERTKSLWGAFNTSMVNSDYAHIFCAPEHLEGECISSLQFIDKIIKMFGFEYYWYFKGRGQEFAGTEKRWDKAIDSFNLAFQKCGLAYTADLQEGVFAGPCVQARLIDSFGREWNGPSISLDFNAPEKMGLSYKGTDGKLHVPLMMVRILFGSLERFVALLLEHTSGKLPSWLLPEQENTKLGNWLESK